jgi:hypothetical protein
MDGEEEESADQCHHRLEDGCDPALAVTTDVLREAGGIQNSATKTEQRENARRNDAVPWHFQAEEPGNQDTSTQREGAEEEGHAGILFKHADTEDAEPDDHSGCEEDGDPDAFHFSAQEMCGV